MDSKKQWQRSDLGQTTSLKEHLGSLKAKNSQCLARMATHGPAVMQQLSGKMSRESSQDPENKQHLATMQKQISNLLDQHSQKCQQPEKHNSQFCSCISESLESSKTDELQIDQTPLSSNVSPQFEPFHSYEKGVHGPSKIGTAHQSPWSNAFGIASRLAESHENLPLRQQSIKSGENEESSLFKARVNNVSLKQIQDVFTNDSFLRRQSGCNTNNFGENATPLVLECASPEFLKEVSPSKRQNIVHTLRQKHLTGKTQDLADLTQKVQSPLSAQDCQQPRSVRRKLVYSPSSKPSNQQEFDSGLMHKIMLFDKTQEGSTSKKETYLQRRIQKAIEATSSPNQYSKLEVTRSPTAVTHDSEQQNGFLQALAETLKELQVVKAKKKLIDEDKRQKAKVKDKLAQLAPLQQPSNETQQPNRSSKDTAPLSGRSETIRIPLPRAMIDVQRGTPSLGPHGTIRASNLTNSQGTLSLNREIFNTRRSIQTEFRPTSTLCIGDKSSARASSRIMLNSLSPKKKEGAYTSTADMQKASLKNDFIEAMKVQHLNKRQLEQKDIEHMQVMYSKTSKIPNEKMIQNRNIVFNNFKKSVTAEDLLLSQGSASPFQTKLSHRFTAAASILDPAKIGKSQKGVGRHQKRRTSVELRVSTHSTAQKQTESVQNSNQNKVQISRLARGLHLAFKQNQNTQRQIQTGSRSRQRLQSRTNSTERSLQSPQRPAVSMREGIVCISQPMTERTRNNNSRLTGFGKNSESQKVPTEGKKSASSMTKDCWQSKKVKLHSLPTKIFKSGKNSISKELLRRKMPNRVRSAIDFCNNQLQYDQENQKPNQGGLGHLRTKQGRQYCVRSQNSDYGAKEITSEQPTKGDKSVNREFADEVSQSAHAMFPFPIFDRNIQIMLPRQGSSHQMTCTSPFLLALNEEKLTPFQTIKGFQKTKKLMIEKGLMQKRVNLDSKFSSQLLPKERVKTTVKNPNILKLRKQSQKLLAAKNQCLVHGENMLKKQGASEKQNEEENFNSAPLALISSQGQNKEEKDFKRSKQIASVIKREKQAQILYAVGVPMLTETWAHSDLSDLKSSAERLIEVLDTNRRGSTKSVNSNGAESDTYLESKFSLQSNFERSRKQSSTAVRKETFTTNKKRNSDSKLNPLSSSSIASSRDLRVRKKSSQTQLKNRIDHNVHKQHRQDLKLNLQNSAVKNQSTQNMLEDVNDVVIDTEEIGTLRNDTTDYCGSFTSAGGPQKEKSAQILDTRPSSKRVVIEIVDFDEINQINEEASRFEETEQKPHKSQYQPKTHPSGVVSPQFINRWTVQQTDKVIEVEEEASILNPTTRVSKIGIERPTFGANRDKDMVIEETPNKRKNTQLRLQQSIQQVKLSTSTLTMPIKQPKVKVRVPFSSTKKLVSATKKVIVKHKKGDSMSSLALSARPNKPLSTEKSAARTSSVRSRNSPKLFGQLSSIERSHQEGDQQNMTGTAHLEKESHLGDFRTNTEPPLPLKVSETISDTVHLKKTFQQILTLDSGVDICATSMTPDMMKTLPNFNQGTETLLNSCPRSDMQSTRKNQVPTPELASKTGRDHALSPRIPMRSNLKNHGNSSISSKSRLAIPQVLESKIYSQGDQHVIPGVGVDLGLVGSKLDLLVMSTSTQRKRKKVSVKVGQSLEYSANKGLKDEENQSREKRFDDVSFISNDSGENNSSFEHQLGAVTERDLPLMRAETSNRPKSSIRHITVQSHLSRFNQFTQSGSLEKIETRRASEVSDIIKLK